MWWLAFRNPYWSRLEVAEAIAEICRSLLLKASPDMIASEPLDSPVTGLDGVIKPPMLSLTASAILIDLRRSSSLIDVSLESLMSGSSSSANPAAYMSMASSTVIPPALEPGRDRASAVNSVMEVPLVATLLLSVLVVSMRLEVVVSAERKLDLTSSLL